MAVTPTPTFSGRVRETLARNVLAPSWAIGLLVVPFVIGLHLPLWMQLLPFGASLVLFGLPHGAVDHSAVGRAGLLDRPRAFVAFVYPVCGGCYLALWFVAPGVAAAVFIVLTWYHWGQGDLYTLLSATGGTQLETRFQRAGTVVVRGGLPMLVPLLSFPEVYGRVIESLLAPFGQGSTAVRFLELVAEPSVRFVIGGGFVGLSIGMLALGYVRSDDSRSRDAWRLDVFETVLLWGYFLVVPPILAIGVYFSFWHSTRHIARVATLDETGRAVLAAGRITPVLSRFARGAAVNTAGALCLLGVLFVVLPADGSMALLSRYLVLIATLTLPHVLIVTWLDISQRLWTPPA